MLQNAYLIAKIGADTAENEQHLAEILPIGRRVADRRDDADAEAAVEAALRRAHLRERNALCWLRKCNVLPDNVTKCY